MGVWTGPGSGQSSEIPGKFIRWRTTSFTCLGPRVISDRLDPSGAWSMIGCTTTARPTMLSATSAWQQCARVGSEPVRSIILLSYLKDTLIGRMPLPLAKYAWLANVTKKLLPPRSFPNKLEILAKIERRTTPAGEGRKQSNVWIILNNVHFPARQGFPLRGHIRTRDFRLWPSASSGRLVLTLPKMFFS